jgi:hypothetical protein
MGGCSVFGQDSTVRTADALLMHYRSGPPANPIEIRAFFGLVGRIGLDSKRLTWTFVYPHIIMDYAGILKKPHFRP